MFPQVITTLFASSLLLATQLPHASAIDFKKRCTQDKYFCLTSFVWCDKSTDDGDCEYPDDTFPLRHSGNADIAGLLLSTTYNLTWSGTDPEHPVLVSWMASHTKDGDAKDLLWQRNLTKGETSFSFTFEDLSKELKNTDKLEPGSFPSSMFSTMSISQPERKYTGIDDPSKVADHSSRFVLLGGFTADFFETQREIGADEESKRWSRNVGIGVGIGVPAAMAISGAIGFFIAKRLSARSGSGNARYKITSIGHE